MTLDQLNELVRNTIKDVTSIPEAIQYYPNAPRPEGEYASVNIAELVQVGMRDIKFVENGEDLDEILILLYEAMVSVNFYRNDARQHAGVFAGMLRSNPVIENFNAHGVGFIRPSAIRDITFLQNVEYEDRAQVDLFLEFELSSPASIVTGIDIVKVEGDVDNSTEIIELVEIIIP